MSLIEHIKALAIRATDVINLVNDPFEEFTRPTLPKEKKLLKDLEQEFYQDLVTNFWGCDGQVLLHRIPLPPGSALDMGDQAIWHGVYTAMLAMRWNQESKQGGGDPTSTYTNIVYAVKGLELHQTAHGESLPRLIRGVSDDLKTWQDDASNDSASGHLLGIYFGWKFGPPTLRPVFEKLAKGLADEILAHGHALVRSDGSPTTYGALVQGWRTDPLRITLALAIYAVAATVSRDPRYMKAYSDLFVSYRPIVGYPKVRLWWMDNSNDTHRAAIHLAILADLTTGEPMHIYLNGLARVQNMVRKHGNVWVNALCAWAFGNISRWNRTAGMEIARKVLSEFTLADKQFNDGRDNVALGHEVIGFGNGQRWWYEPVKWNGKLMANQPLPRWRVRAQDFFWQRNLYSLDGGTGGYTADSRLNGGDFLAAYWMSRQANLISAND